MTASTVATILAAHDACRHARHDVSCAHPLQRGSRLGVPRDPASYTVRSRPATANALLTVRAT